MLGPFIKAPFRNTADAHVYPSALLTSYSLGVCVCVCLVSISPPGSPLFLAFSVGLPAGCAAHGSTPVVFYFAILISATFASIVNYGRSFMFCIIYLFLLILSFTLTPNWSRCNWKSRCACFTQRCGFSKLLYLWSWWDTGGDTPSSRCQNNAAQTRTQYCWHWPCLKPFIPHRLPLCISVLFVSNKSIMDCVCPPTCKDRGLTRMQRFSYILVPFEVGRTCGLHWP